LLHRFTKDFYRNVKVITNAYSPDIKLPKIFAPAITHNGASLLILSRITKVGGYLLLKVLSFLLF
jgi:hypothetical protein